MLSNEHGSESGPLGIVRYLWRELGLPDDALSSLQLPGSGLGLPSSFKVGDLAQASIALSALAAATLFSSRNQCQVPTVTVSRQHACAEFCSERLYTLNGKAAADKGTAVGGMHKTTDGYVRIHDGFPNHREAALKILGIDERAGRDEIDKILMSWKSEDLENAAVEQGAVIAALRSYEEWDALPRATAIHHLPILIRKIADGHPNCGGDPQNEADKCLRGIRIVEMSRVIAAPVAGKTLAAHGADVLWITSPNLPSLPTLDIDVSRGKRTAQLDLRKGADFEKLQELLTDADVFLQSYRPGSLAGKGLSSSELAAKSKNGIICANLSAWGPDGPWSRYRGFDSIVQTASGLNVSEAENFGQANAPKPMPCQALDHASGYFLATGIIAALYSRAVEGGSYQVDVSLAGTMKYLRGLHQYEGSSGFQCGNYLRQGDVPEDFLETKETGFGSLKAVKHSASIEGLRVGWDNMPKLLGSDDATWI